MGMWAEKISSIYTNLLRMREYAVTEDWIFQHVLKDFME